MGKTLKIIIILFSKVEWLMADRLDAATKSTHKRNGLPTIKASKRFCSNGFQGLFQGTWNDQLQDMFNAFEGAGLRCFKLNLVPWKGLPTVFYHPLPSTRFKKILDTRSLHPAIFLGTIIASPCFSPKQELNVHSFTTFSASARHWNQRNPRVSKVLEEIPK